MEHFLGALPLPSDNLFMDVLSLGAASEWPYAAGLK